MKTVYIHSGKQYLPGMSSTKKLLSGKGVIPTNIDIERSLGLVTKGAFLANTNLKSLEVGRTVRKTSERQARWVIKAGVKSWDLYASNVSEKIDKSKTGLFLGLGTIDCEDDDEPIPLQSSTKFNDYAAELLANTKPLSGLTLLNSTTASHIAHLTHITGMNAVFSPFSDAGGQAITEAFFAIEESYCQQALVVAGSHKITPWYFLSHREYFNEPLNHGAFPTESSGGLVLSSERQGAHASLLKVKRSFGLSEQFPKEIVTFLNQGIGAQQIIYTGKQSLSQEQLSQLQEFMPNASICCLDQLLGYTGAAGPLHALQLACDQLDDQSYRKKHGIACQSIDAIMIIVQGFHGQWCCFLVVPL